MLSCLLASGTEEWNKDVLNRFTEIYRKWDAKDKEMDSFKMEVKELKQALVRKQTRIDQLEENDTSKENEIKTLKTQVEDMAIQGMKV